MPIFVSKAKFTFQDFFILQSLIPQVFIKKQTHFQVIMKQAL